MVERSPLIHLAVSLFAAKDTTSRSPDGIVGPDNDLEPLVGCCRAETEQLTSSLTGISPDRAASWPARLARCKPHGDDLLGRLGCGRR